MNVLVWVLYAFCLALVWYEKWGMVQSVPFKPPILCRRHMAVFWMSRLALLVTALLGLWRLYGLTTALGCAALHFAVRTICLHYYGNREMLRWAEYYKQTERENTVKSGAVLDERKLAKDSTEFAKHVVIKNLNE